MLFHLELVVSFVDVVIYGSSSNFYKRMLEHVPRDTVDDLSLQRSNRRRITRYSLQQYKTGSCQASSPEPLCKLRGAGSTGTRGDCIREHVKTTSSRILRK